MLLELGAAILEKGDNSEKLSWVLIKFKVLSLYLKHKSFDKIVFSEKNMRLKKRPTFGPLSTIGLKLNIRIDWPYLTMFTVSSS